MIRTCAPGCAVPSPFGSVPMTVPLGTVSLNASPRIGANPAFVISATAAS
jgi:hypothetical protein